MWIFIKCAFIGYILLTALVFLFQRNLMYHPSRAIGSPEKYGLHGIEEGNIQSTDNVRLQIWKHEAKPGYPTIIYFHGNAGNMGDRAAKFSNFTDNGFGLVVLSYRGFGKSEGYPTEAGIYDDARAVVAYAVDTLNLPYSSLIYFGESLGSGVAVQMAMEKPPALLMLEAAYTSVETRSAELYPYLLGVRHLVLDKYDSLEKIGKVHAPLLMLHGEKDPTIPVTHGRTLFAAANEPKEIVFYKDVHHVDYTNEQIMEPLLKACRRFNLIP